MLRLLIDTNIVIDVALRRHPFYDDAMEIMNQDNAGNCIGFVTATTVTNRFYVLRKPLGRNVALQHIRNLVESKYTYIC
jgi:predicted nucleic acid-binding protein